MKFHQLTTLALCYFTVTNAFTSLSISSTPARIARGNVKPQLFMSTPSTTTPPQSSSTRKPKKTIRDRSQEELNSLIRDILQAIIEAGPRAGPARTIQAYTAVTRTIQDFLPSSGVSTRSPTLFPLGSPGSSSAARKEPETFSAPLALRKLFERMGATYIKLGQFIASSPTLFPSEYVLEFQKCLDATEPLEWNVIKGVIEKEIGGKPLSTVYKSIDQTPLASASIAQVHAATLNTGEDVVIKVQKPRIDDSLKADLSFIYVASRVLEFIQPDFERTSLSGIAGDLKSSMLEELDFSKEATNMEEFNVFLSENNLRDVAAVPKVYREFTTKKILTMERFRGASMLDLDEISKITKDNPESTIVTALNVWTTSVMQMPWFHADVHAGNLFVLEDGRVGFIDFGIVGRVSEKTFQAVNELSGALALGDYRGMAVALCNMGATDEEVNIDQFSSDIEKLMVNLGSMQPDVTVTANLDSGDVSSSLDFDETEVTQVVLDMVDVAENNGLKLPREFGLLVKQSLYFDRYLKILAPNLDVMSDDRIQQLGAAGEESGPSDAGESVVVEVIP